MHMKNAKGLWTRSEGGSKSVIDYVIISRNDANVVDEMVIDEEKKWGLYKSAKSLRTTNGKLFSDHNTILVKLDFLEARRNNAK